MNSPLNAQNLVPHASDIECKANVADVRAMGEDFIDGHSNLGEFGIDPGRV